MLKTNSKKAKENLKDYISDEKDYIIAEYSEDVTGVNSLDSFSDLAKAILNIFAAEKAPIGAYALMTHKERFNDWASGLPLSGLFLYYYNKDVYDTIGDILEETDDEKETYRNKISRSDAERLMTDMIYNTLTEAASSIAHR